MDNKKIGEKSAGDDANKNGGPDWSILEAMVGKYDARERARVDRYKTEIGESLSKVEYERKAEASPGLLKKIGRLALDMAGIEIKRDIAHREHEAIGIALNEYEKERAAEEEKWWRQFEEEERKRIERERERKMEQERREREELERDMSDARGVFEYNKKNRFEQQRVQEIVERDLNERLLKVDDLEEEVLADNPEVDKRFMKYRDVKIPVYDLKGVPFSMLTHAVDYRRANDKMGGGAFMIGTATYKNVMDNPAEWNKREDVARNDNGFGTRNANAKGNTISTSYTNSWRNLDSRMTGRNSDLIYGFSRVEAGSILSVINGDGGTPNFVSRDAEPNYLSIHSLDNLEGASGTLFYNEILLKRYSENGVAKRPDFIVVDDGRISEASLRHAKYFGVPIVNIENKIYIEKMRRRGSEILDSLDDGVSYEELNKKLCELRSMAHFKPLMNFQQSVGRNFDIPRLVGWSAQDSESVKCFEAARMEFDKRIDFIEEILKNKDIAKVEDFSVRIKDIHNGKEISQFGETIDGYYRAPGNCNWIEIGFGLNGERFETRIYDGENIFELEKAKQTGHIRQEDIDKADSSIYRRILPLAEGYLKSIRIG